MKLEMNGTTAKQRRMAVKIAEDVLRSSRHWEIETGDYLTVNPNYVCRKGTCPVAHLGEKIKKGTDPKAFRHCSVCARGAMFLSRAILFDNVTLPVGFHEARISVQATTESDIGSLNAGMIEAAFEMDYEFAECEGALEEDAEAAAQFGKKYREARERLRAIMKNVIANKGVFRP